VVGAEDVSRAVDEKQVHQGIRNAWSGGP
jgi:hypothetical protein